MKGKVKAAEASISQTFTALDELIRHHLPVMARPFPGKDELQRILSQYKLLNNSFSVIHGILNFADQRYIYLTDNVDYIGGERSRMMDEGLPYILQLFHPDEQPVISKGIIPAVIRFLGASHNAHKLTDARATFTTRVRIHNGEYRWFIHQLSILDTDEHNAPVLALKLLMEIEGIKQNKELNLVLALRDEKGRYHTVQEHVYPVQGAGAPFSKRELEVLKLITAGKTSKEIAAILHISEHTVNNHRKNILRKKEAGSGQELVQGAGADRPYLK